MLVPEINLTPQLVARVRHALPGLSVATLHSGLPAGERSAAWHAAAAGDAQARPRHAARGLRADARVGTRRRRRGAGRVVQAAGRRPLPRARRRRLARAPPRRAGRAGQRDAVARVLAARARRPLPPPRPARARRSARVAAARQADGEPRRARAGRHRRPDARSDRDPARARRAVAGVREPPRFRAFARVRIVPVGGAVPALQRPAHHAPRAAAPALPSLRTRGARARGVPGVRQRRPAAAGIRHAAARARAGGGVPGRAHRAGGPRHHAGARMRSRRCATRSARARSTSSSARRCWRRGTISRG